MFFVQMKRAGGDVQESILAADRLNIVVTRGPFVENQPPFLYYDYTCAETTDNTRV